MKRTGFYDDEDERKKITLWWAEKGYVVGGDGVVVKEGMCVE